MHFWPTLESGCAFGAPLDRVQSESPRQRVERAAECRRLHRSPPPPAGEMSPNSIPKYLKRPLWRERKWPGRGARGRATVGQRRARQSHGAPPPARRRLPHSSAPPSEFIQPRLSAALRCAAIFVRYPLRSLWGLSLPSHHTNDELDTFYRFYTSRHSNIIAECFTKEASSVITQSGGSEWRGERGAAAPGVALRSAQRSVPVARTLLINERAGKESPRAHRR
ncbi:hypothetical protein K1T71_006046 [Dendrolimus kikuchii]|uniref:Uncharacterized protein n=1 Tax=Dendrolimus kikuchii TaxID=765133 RepID=A0ACC1D2S1_9NEOP|nr:hypothetical protein K1T71_006046 [Dendrolimus kikuchii]